MVSTQHPLSVLKQCMLIMLIMLIRIREDDNCHVNSRVLSMLYSFIIKGMRQIDIDIYLAKSSKIYNNNKPTESDFKAHQKICIFW